MFVLPIWCVPLPLSPQCFNVTMRIDYPLTIAYRCMVIWYYNRTVLSDDDDSWFWSVAALSKLEPVILFSISYPWLMGRLGGSSSCLIQSWSAQRGTQHCTAQIRYRVFYKQRSYTGCLYKLLIFILNSNMICTLQHTPLTALHRSRTGCYSNIQGLYRGCFY